MQTPRIRHVLSAALHFVGRLGAGLWAMAKETGSGSEERFGPSSIDQLLPEVAILHQIISHGAVVIDVGANTGEFTKTVYELVKPDGFIYSFEPQDQPFRALQDACKGKFQVYPHKVGLSSVSGESTLFVPIVNGRLSPPEASIDPAFNLFTGPEKRPKADRSVAEKIQLVRLDDFLRERRIDRLDFVKIDVEGHELEVLKGGSELLLRVLRPVFLIEVFPYVYAGHLDKVCRYMNGFQYSAYVLNRDRSILLPLTSGNAEFSEGYNYFFFPNEKIAGLVSLFERNKRA